MSTEWIDVSDITPRIAYTATASQTVFAVPFVFFGDSDLSVYQNTALLTLDTDYTVSGAEDEDGGSITLTTGASAGDAIMIARHVPVEQTTHIPPSGPLDIPAINIQISKLVAMIQQIDDDLDRTLHLADSDTIVDTELPNAADRANLSLGFDSDGSFALVNPIGPQGVSGGTQQYFTTRAQAIGTAINTGLTVITIGAYSSTSAFAPAYYKPGSSSGILAFQDASSNWWELDATGQILNIAWFGGTPTDASANTSAANAIAALSGGYAIHIPRGWWEFNDTVSLTKSSQRIIGAGMSLTTLNFSASTHHQAFLKWANPGGVYQSYCGISGVSIRRNATGIIAHAIELQNTSIFAVHDVAIQNWHDTLAGFSRGFYLRGREITNISSVIVDADWPVYVDENPERGSALEIDCDFLTIKDVQLTSIGSIAANNPCVSIQDGVNVTNFTMDGFDMSGGLNSIEWTTTTNNIALAQSRGTAGNLTLNGYLVSAGTGTFAVARKLGITSTTNNSGVNFTITGTDQNSAPQNETIAGPNVTTVFTTKRWKTITQIATSAATVGNVQCGKAPEGVNSGFDIRNGRHEQLSTPGGCFLFIDRQNSFELRSVSIDQILAAYVGIHLTGNISGVSVKNLYHASSTLPPFVLDSLVTDFTWHACIFQFGAPSGVAGQTAIYELDKRPSYPHGRSGFFVPTTAATLPTAAAGYAVSGTQVVGARIAGWNAPSGTQTRGTFTVGGATTASTAEALAALIADLRTHGLIGS